MTVFEGIAEDFSLRQHAIVNIHRHYFQVWQSRYSPSNEGTVVVLATNTLLLLEVLDISAVGVIESLWLGGFLSIELV